MDKRAHLASNQIALRTKMPFFMTMKWISTRKMLLTLCVGMIWLQLELLAQSQSTNLDKETAETSSKQEAIRKLIAKTGSEQALKALFTNVVAKYRQAITNAPEQYWEELLREFDAKGLIDACIPIYERHFSQKEIGELISFYDTSIGKKSIEKMPIIAQETMEVAYAWGTNLDKRVQMKLAEYLTTNQNQNTTTDQEQESKPPRRRLTEEQEIEWLSRQGFDPDWFYVTEDGYVRRLGRRRGSYTEKQISNQATGQPINSEVKYLIVVKDASGNQRSYMSKEEPKPYSGGFRFKMYPGDVETTVWNVVQIYNLSNKK